MVRHLTSWLIEVGSWIFGGLIAFSIVMISALLTVGPVDAAILTSTTAFAVALPLSIAGVFVLRLIKDINDVGLDDLAWQSFKAAGFPRIETYFPPALVRASMHERRAVMALGWSLGVLTLSVASVVTGLVAALWHMRWWIGVVAIAVAFFTSVLTVVVIARSLPPETEQEQELRRRIGRDRT
jgi:hypothetical protein